MAGDKDLGSSPQRPDFLIGQEKAIAMLIEELRQWEHLG